MTLITYRNYEPFVPGRPLPADWLFIAVMVAVVLCLAVSAWSGVTDRARPRSAVVAAVVASVLLLPTVTWYGWGMDWCYWHPEAAECRG